MDAFETLAEVAIGLAGFGTLANVLARDPARWSSADFFRSVAFFMSSLGALFLALLPIGLGTTSLAEAAIWRVTSGLLLVYTVVFSIALVRLRRRHLQRELWFGPLLITITWTTTLLNLAAQLANVIGVPWAPAAAAVWFGIVWLLIYASVMLVRIVFLPPPTPDTHREGRA